VSWDTGCEAGHSFGSVLFCLSKSTQRLVHLLIQLVPGVF
jgi:hypothetical protein